MLDQLNASLDEILFQTWQHRYILASMIGILFFVYFLTLLSGGQLLFLGIIPRRLIGLRGILFSPFLHANFNHLFFNSIPLIVLANFMLIYGETYFYFTTILIALISGGLTWLIAKPGIHIGASSVITGYWTVLAFNLFNQPSLTSLILALISIYYFAGIFFGIFPSEKSVSWEGHLSGFVAGLIVHFIN